MTTQVQNEGSDLAVYSTGSALAKSPGILEAYDMTTEAGRRQAHVAAAPGLRPRRRPAHVLHAHLPGHPALNTGAGSGTANAKIPSGALG